jgi:hypothetical protein
LTLVSTVEKTSEGFRKCQVARAQAAGGIPSHQCTHDLKAIVRANQIANCLVTAVDICEHISKMEERIRVIKERVRATRHPVRFKYITLLMLIGLMCSSALWINILLQFGSYVRAPTALTVGAIGLGPTGDIQGSCKLLFLNPEVTSQL